MTLHRTTSLVALACVALTSAAASAQPLFADRADITTERFAELRTVPIALDDTGHAYYGRAWASSDPNHQVFCADLAAGPDPPEHGVWLSVIQDTSLMPGGYKGGGYAATAQLPDFSGLGVFAFRGRDVRIARIDCETAAANTTLGAGWTEIGAWTLDEDVPWLGVREQDPAMRATVAPDGAWCFEVAEGLRCFVPPAGPDEAPRFELRVDLAAVAALVAIDPGHEAATIDPVLLERGELLPLETLWTIRATTWRGDGTVFFVADATLSRRRIGTTSLIVGLPHVFARHPDGSYEAIILPARPGEAQPLERAPHLRYDPGLDAILAGPVPNLEQARDASDFTRAGGLGFWVLPLAEPGHTGYLSVTQALVRDLWCGTVYCNPGPQCSGGEVQTCSTLAGVQLVDLPGGGLGLTLLHGNRPEDYLAGNNGNRRVGLRRVSWDPATLDLDEDGLLASEEEALGGSDYTSNSDDVLVSDPLEVWFAGTDPGDPYDDPAALPPLNVRYAASGLVRRILPEDLRDADWRAPISVSPDGPLCLATVCVLRDRATRVAIPEDMRPTGTRWLVMAQDGGSLVASGEEGGMQRLSLRTGERETLLAPATLSALVGPWVGAGSSVVEVLPVSDELVWLAVNARAGDGSATSPAAQDDLRIYAVTDGAARLVYDQQQARCDSELGPCDPIPVGDRPPSANQQLTAWNDLIGGQWARMVGWMPGLERLMVAVPARWDRYMLALHPEAPPRVLARGRHLPGGGQVHGLPDWHGQTGHGDVLYRSSGKTIGGDGLFYTTTAWGLTSTWMTTLPLTFIEGWGYTPHIFWGDVVVTAESAHEPPWELVRYEGGNQPGDALALFRPIGQANGDEAAMLWRSGPRGGLAPALVQEEPGLLDVWGMDLGEDGRLCFARRDAGEIGWLESSAAAPLTPGVELARWRVGPAVDCRVQADGATLVLMQDPARIVRYDTPFSAPTLVETLEGTPLAFVDRPDGALEVLREDDGLRGLLYLRDGRRVEAPTGEPRLLIDGDVIDLGSVLWFTTPAESVAAEREWRLVMAERPDGLIVAFPAFAAPHQSLVLKTASLVVDPDSGEVLPLSPHSYVVTGPVALTIAPGGVASDPWTGGPHQASTREPPDPTIPTQAPPTGGAASYGPAPDDGGGCASGGSEPSPLALWAVALLATAWLGRRPRRPAPRRAWIEAKRRAGQSPSSLR